jgi:hypothetical protein
MNIIEIIQSMSNIIVILGGFIGAIWAYYKFKKLRAVKKALTLKIVPTIHHHDDYAIVEIAVEFVNNGTVPIFALPESMKECILRVRAVPPCKGNLLFQLDSEECKDIVEPIEYLSQYEPTNKTPITLEPGVPAEVHGYGIFITKHQGPFLLHAEFYDSDGVPWVEGKIIDTTKRAKQDEGTQKE